MPDPIVIVPYDLLWPGLFLELGTALREVLGEADGSQAHLTRRQERVELFWAVVRLQDGILIGDEVQKTGDKR